MIENIENKIIFRNRELLWPIHIILIAKFNWNLITMSMRPDDHRKKWDKKEYEVKFAIYLLEFKYLHKFLSSL